MPRGTSCGSPPGSGTIGTAVSRRPREAAMASSARASASAGSSRTLSGSDVRDAGAPARLEERIASRLRVSGRRRTTTTWSAPVPAPSSSAIASTMASGETERARPRRIRAKDSASVRRVLSSPTISSRSRTVARASSPMRPRIRRSRGRRSTRSRTSSTAPRATKVRTTGRRARARSPPGGPIAPSVRPRISTLAQRMRPRSDRDKPWDPVLMASGPRYFRTGSGRSGPHRTRQRAFLAGRRSSTARRGWP